MTALLLYLLLQTITVGGLQNEATTCDVVKLNEIDKKLPNLTGADVVNFLLMFRQECLNNAEFGEYSNELLFKVMFYNPEKVLKALDEEGRIDTGIVFREIEDPINDRIGVEDLKKKIEAINVNSSAKRRVLYFLDKAIY